MAKCILRKFILKKINELLSDYDTNVTKAKQALELWSTRAQKILDCLKKMLEKLEDNQVSAEEVEQAVDELKVLVQEWK